MINLYGEIHPEYVDLLRNTPENLELLMDVATKISECRSFEQNLFFKVFNNIQSGVYNKDIKLYDVKLKEFYSQVKPTGKDLLLMEGVLHSENEIEAKLKIRHLSKNLFKQVIMIDPVNYQFMNERDREKKWLIPIKTFATKSFDLHVLAGKNHFSTNAITSKNNLETIIPNTPINSYIMELAYSNDFIKDCNDFDHLISKFVNLY